MAEDHVHKQEFSIRELSTSSVTLFPARANVIREIKDVILKPGANEITVHGLTPTADENSIKVDGKGSATITDMMVELVTNRDRYEDVYPSGSETDTDSDDDSAPEGESDLVGSLKANEEKIIQAMKRSQEQKASASGTLKILEDYGRQIENDSPAQLADRLSMYQQQRKKAFEVFNASEIENADLLKQKIDVGKRLKKAIDQELKVKSKESQRKQKQRSKKLREKEKFNHAKRQQKVDRIKFWPKKVYKVIVSLDSISELTPSSSRRGSISSTNETVSKSDAYHINVSISYITSSATWSPRYDLSLHTPTCSGSIMYRAEYSNTTSETWEDAKITLSTSQTAFQGLGEAIPRMQPWHIDLARSGFGVKSGAGPLYSNHEHQYVHSSMLFSTQRTAPPRESLFGLDNLDADTQHMLQQQNVQNVQSMNRHQNLFANNNKPAPPVGGLFGSSNALPKQQPQAPQQSQGQAFRAPLSGGPFASNANTSAGSNAFGGPSSSTAGVFGSFPTARSRNAVPAAPADGFGGSSQPLADEDSPDLEPTGDDATIVPDIPDLDTVESCMSESGLTVNYEIPGFRTIKPSFTFRRHKIASISLKDVQLSHLVVAKLRAAAFLRARIRNSSSIALLRGPVGVTLDGSFLGNTALPRSSPSETFSLNLGVDPSVNVVYSKPTVKKSQSGILNKESSSIYTRTCTITNTRQARNIEGLLLDQVPVSNEERLRVEVLQPRGLKREGDNFRTGTGITTAGKEDPKWGKAAAIFKKAGEICFDFKIEGGKGARFSVEYETRHPSNEQVLSL